MGLLLVLYYRTYLISNQGDVYSDIDNDNNDI